MDNAIFDPLQRRVLLVEAGHREPILLAACLHGRNDLRAIVRPKPDKKLHIGIRIDDILDVGAGPGEILVVVLVGDDLDLRVFYDVHDALVSLAGIVCGTNADEESHLASFGKYRLDLLSQCSPCLIVVRSNVDETVRVGSI